MNTQIYYLFFEIKRCFRRIFRMAAVILLLAVICCGLAICTFHASDSETAVSPYTVVVVMPKNGGIQYNMAFGMVSQMDSLKGMTTILQTDDEQAALDMLESKKAAAVIIIPDGMINSILEGSNLPATILYPAELSIETVLFRNTIDSLANMLSASQAGVYALYDIYADYNASERTQSHANSELNSLYMNMVLRRSQYFSQESLSFDSDSSAYLSFAAGALALLFFLSGICLCDYLAPHPEARFQTLTRLGIHPFILCLGQVLGAFISQLFLFFILGIILLIGIQAVGYSFPISLNFLFTFAVSIFFVASFQFLIFQLCPNRQAGIAVLFVLSFFLTFTAGGLLPAAFLPNICRKLFSINPAWHLLTAISQGFYGQISFVSCLVLLLYGLLFMLFPLGFRRYFSFLPSSLFSEKTILSKRKRIFQHLFTEKKETSFACIKNFRFIAWLFLLAKRTLQKPVYWILAAAILTVGIAAGSVHSTSISIGIYCSQPDEFTQEILSKLLTSDPDRLYRFYIAASEEELKEDVLWGKAECGYLIPDKLLPILNQKTTDEAILTYTGASTTLDFLVMEEVFSSILDSYAPIVLSDYIREDNAISISETDLKEKTESYYSYYVSSDSTFHVEYEDVPDEFFSNQAAFAIPIRGISALILLVFVMAGISQYRHDLHKQNLLVRYPKEAYYLPVLYGFFSSLLPVLSIFFCLIFSCRDYSGFIPELLYLLLYLTELLCFSMLTSKIIKSDLFYDAFILFLVLFCVLYSPVLMDTSSYLPFGTILSYLAPSSWYLKL